MPFKCYSAAFEIATNQMLLSDLKKLKKIADRSFKHLAVKVRDVQGDATEIYSQVPNNRTGFESDVNMLVASSTRVFLVLRKKVEYHGEQGYSRA